MELGELEKLRLINQDLLQRLKANQEEFRKRLPSKCPSWCLQSKQEAPENGQAPEPQRGKENQNWAAEEFAGIGSRVSQGAGSQPGLRPPSKPTASHKEEERETLRPGGWHPGSARPEEASELSATEAESTQATSQRVKKCYSLGDSERKSIPTSQTDFEKHPAHRPKPKAEVEPSQTRVKGSHRPSTLARMPRTPKSILLTPECKEAQEKTKKEVGRVTFVSDPEEFTLPADDWSVRPFLGYDWIAGLLDMDSSVSEKPEEYFSELQDFRRVRGDGLFGSQSRIGERIHFPSVYGVFCYRLNKRLFAMPLGSEAACPICKTRRTQQPPETLVEPAFVRISIPRSTLLPAYKHKIHRRKSYQPADDLALPTHCLAGWENSVQTFSSTLSSLDLRSTLAAKPSGHLDWLMRRLLAMWLVSTSGFWLQGYVSYSRAQAEVDEDYPAHYPLLEPNSDTARGGQRAYWSSWQPWICMCNIHKQARIRHLVAWAANLSLPLEAREFWEERPCSLEECNMCQPEECSEDPGRSGPVPPMESFSLDNPHDSEIPLPPNLDSEAYDNLPVVDDTG